MNVRLTPELEAIVRAKVASGRYKDEAEVIAEALDALSNRDEDEHAALLVALDEGEAAFAAGDFITIKDRDELRAFFESL